MRLPTQHPAWVRAAAETFGRDGRLHLVRAPAPSVGLAPLVRRRRAGIARLELLAAEELSEPSDLVAADGASLDALTSELRHTGRPLRLERVPVSSPTLASLRRSYGRGVVLARPQTGTPTLTLDETWRDPLSRLSSRRRADIRRATRRAEREGAVRFELRAPETSDEIESALDEIWDVEARSWRAQRGGALAQDPVRGPFFRALGRHAGEAGIFRAAFLYVGDRIAAMQYALECAESFWLLKIGYDEAFAKCSPGTLLMVASIAHAAESRLASYEFLGVVEEWTSLWTERNRECVSLRAYPLGPRGLAALGLDAMGAAGRWIGTRLPGRKR